jgi:hypothetical protein
MTVAEYLRKLSAYLLGGGLARVHADAIESPARAAFAALAGLPHFEQLWAGDLRESVQIVAVAFADHLPAVEFARRALELHERALAMADKVVGDVQVLQLALYDRPVSPQECEFVLGEARVSSWWPLARGSVATWVGVLREPQLYSARFRGWPQELAADQLRALLS